MKPITICLGFNKELEEAVATYIGLFDAVFGNSKILGRSYFGEREIAALRQVPEMSEEIMPGSAGDVKTIRFTLNGEEIVAFNGGSYFGKFHESMSLYVSCDTQEQIDRLWAVLSEGGEEHPWGWVKDRFGVSWQIVPSWVWEVGQGADRRTELSEVGRGRGCTCKQAGCDSYRRWDSRDADQNRRLGHEEIERTVTVS